MSAAAPTAIHPLDDAVAPERLARALDVLAAIMERRGALVAQPIYARIEAAHARALAGDPARAELARILAAKRKGRVGAPTADY